MTRRLTTEEFIERAKSAHDVVFDYSKSVYVRNNIKLTISCPIHGEFSQTPGNHVNLKQGCPKCGGTEKLTLDDFINKANRVHKNKFTYCQSVYVNNVTKVEILCPKHGIFTQTPRDHLSGYGCPSCCKTTRLTTGEFIRRAINVHGDRYSYTLSVYKNKDTKLSICCDSHGVFTQTPHNHVSLKQGCPLCSKSGFKTNKEGFVYILASSSGGVMKIGITNDVKQRVSQLGKTTPFDFNLLDYFSVPGDSARLIENGVHSILASANLRGFDGATEWFEYDGKTVQMMRDLFS